MGDRLGILSAVGLFISPNLSTQTCILYVQMYVFLHMMPIQKSATLTPLTLPIQAYHEYGIEKLAARWHKLQGKYSSSLSNCLCFQTLGNIPL